ncbi:NAD(P)/FAD-dependent oxidoreductase [Sulfobacillus sp. hq2]|uniref:NAD(P)/FAD-dependent oxidoreductase n=1 Tax=Sulfobacillus TaxID=28033 RepID=UPI002100BCF1|nr:NAD(P)/FAD-dependent oxidoreductase [Sulfobacillus sp. hq2]
MRKDRVMDVVVIGAGPAGLAAGYEAVQQGHQVIVYEQDAHHVGGISRTVEYKGYRFDIGGHRFFSKNLAMETYWKDVLGDDLLRRQRLSRIYYQGKFYDYPLKASNAFRNMGMLKTVQCLASFAGAQIQPITPVTNFEEWVINHFGRQLYQMFFKTYTEKVWGMPCQEISADWAVQRIQGLSLGRAVQAALWPGRQSANGVVKTLTNAFFYPRLGPGMLWEKVAERIREQGGHVVMGAKVDRIIWEKGRGVVQIETPHHVSAVHHVISSMPLRSFVRALHPKAPEEVINAAESLQYRDFLTVGLIIDAPHLFPDQWIYIHDPDLKVGRIQNFKNWSPAMVPDASKTGIGMEYFCFAGDKLWTMTDAALLNLAEQEARATGLLGQARCLDGTVIRVPKAYPVYDDAYENHLRTIRHFLASHLPNVHVAGRNGMHRYNNQDHAMMTGILAAKNVSGAHYDVWAVNGDAQYLETSGSVRSVPQRLRSLKG